MNYYQILGLNTSASQDEIKAAFKKLAKEFHPDKHHGSDAYYENQFKKINSAYQTLSNPDKKYLYDLKLKYRASEVSSASFRTRTAASSLKRDHEQRKAKSAAAHKAKLKREKERKQKLRIYILSGTGLIIFLVISLFFYHYMNHYSAELSIQKGMEAEKQKDYNAALELYSQALEYDDEYAEAYKRRADIKLNIYSNYRSALPDYTKAIKYNRQEQWSTFFARAKCCSKLAMYQNAIQDLESAIRLNPKNDSLYFYRAEINAFVLKNYDEAIIDYNLIISKNPFFFEARYGRSLANMASHQYSKAINDLDYLIYTDSENKGKYFLWRGFSKVSAGDTSSACSDWEISLHMGIQGSQEQIDKYCSKK
jgi:curved DNA-binding protein CbpA